MVFGDRDAHLWSGLLFPFAFLLFPSLFPLPFIFRLATMKPF